MKVLAVVGARPNFMKIAPLMWEFSRRPGVEVCLVHTGQHYDDALSERFFDQLCIPRPDLNLGVGSGSHAAQTAEVLRRIEPVLLERRPDVLLVVGDVNSTVACALAAAKLGIPVAHVEAGLRSFDRSMPEEINRVLTDALSRWLFVTEESGVVNLRREGIPSRNVYFVGNVMIDTLMACRDRIEQSGILDELGLPDRGYAVLTLHRPSNVDDPFHFKRLMDAVGSVSEDVPVVFPVHPRTRKSLTAPGVDLPAGLRLIEPLGYLDFIKLVAHARLVMTDSGGLQEETTALGVPCVTLRENTERPVTLEQGTNELVGTDPARIVPAALRALEAPPATRRPPELWDGHAAERIVNVLISTLAVKNRTEPRTPIPEASRR